MWELSEEGRRLIEALARAPVAWQTPAELASATGLGLDGVIDLVAALDAAGWLSTWEREGDIAVTFSVAGASRLGLRLVEVGREEVPRWAGPGDPEPPTPRAPGVFRSERAANLELVVDASGPVEEAWERLEAASTPPVGPSAPGDRSSTGKWPAPTILVGIGLSPWPGPGRESSCPSCGSRRLGPSMYCLYCDRWGLDRTPVAGPAGLDERPSRASAPRDPIEEAARRDLERRARKAWRRDRRAAQARAERRPGRPGRRAAP